MMPSGEVLPAGLPEGLQTWTGYAHTITADTPDIMPTEGFTIECVEHLPDLSELPRWGAKEVEEDYPIELPTGDPFCYGNLELTTTSDDELLQMMATTYTK